MGNERDRRPKRPDGKVNIWAVLASAGVSLILARFLGIGEGTNPHNPIDGLPISDTSIQTIVQIIMGAIGAVIPVVWTNIKSNPTLGPLINFLEGTTTALQSLQKEHDQTQAEIKELREYLKRKLGE